MKKYLIVIAGIFLLSSCVAKRYLTASQNRVASLQADSTQFESKINTLQNQIATLENSVAGLTNKVATLSSQNSKLGEMTTEQKSKLTQSQRNLMLQRQKLQELQDLLTQQREASERLKNKMSEALKGFGSDELTVFQKDGKVYVRLSENLLFPSGSAKVDPKGVDALSKLAAVLNLNENVSVEIEGHTDSIPISGKYEDNWALSTARANSIVRILVNNYDVDPKRVISSGHSHYDPVDTNATAQGRANNRRTEIILSPKLEELYQLLDK